MKKAIVFIEYDEQEIQEVLKEYDISLQDEIQGWLIDSGIRVLSVSNLIVDGN
jgi:hypothetical protein